MEETQMDKTKEKEYEVITYLYNWANAGIMYIHNVYYTLLILK